MNDDISGIGIDDIPGAAMATLKNPSIYDDRGTIGSADELDAYGVWVKIEPEELPDTGDDSFPDFDADFGPELSLDDAGEADEEAFGDFDFSGGDETVGFDDVEALRQDIQSAPDSDPSRRAADGPVVASAAASGDLSTRLLMKIADELSAIKGELSKLKEELSVIRSEQPGQTTAVAEEGGFFDEEDDGKIALTGDELNNIIHTADFTEETGDDAGASQPDDFAEPDAAAELPATEQSAPEPAEEPAATEGGAPEGEIIYDGLGRPLTRNTGGDEDPGASLELQDTDELRALRESGVEPMTPQPEDTSYLEEDPLAEENLDLSDAVIEEPDLSEGVKDAPLEEPSLDSLPLIDLDTMESSVADNMEDLDLSPLPDLADEESIDLSIFEEDFPLENSGDLSFEVLDDDAELPVHEDMQDNLITADSFESISFDDDDIDELTIDGDLEQSLPEGMKIELDDFPPLELPSSEADTAGPDTENFDLPGSAANADAGDQDAARTEVPAAIRMRLKDVLIYMDKLLESLPEEKINEFAQSEHYVTYKKLFDELGIPQ
jgi:hypothetical protein